MSVRPTQRERELIRGMEGKLHGMALFAGAGGGILASHLLGIETIVAVERDGHCIETLLQRQRDGILRKFPVWDDVRTFDGSQFRGLVSVVEAGFPCQPFSVAGKQKASEDERNGWPHAIGIIREVRPAVALLENVPGLLSQRHGYFGTVLGDLAESGFDAVWDVLGADDVGARHRRKRLWILAYSVRNGAREVLAQLAGQAGPTEIRAGRRVRAQSGNGGPDVADSEYDGDSRRSSRSRDPESTGALSEAEGCGGVHTDANRNGCNQTWRDITETWCDGPIGNARRAAQPRLGGMANGLADRLDTPWSYEPGDIPRVASGVPSRVARLRAIGNGQVPLCAAVAWRLLARRALEVIR